jgi:UDP-N-acetylmuramoyl-tripeptide--D-alanyl-D-alanine ligase
MPFRAQIKEIEELLKLDRRSGSSEVVHGIEYDSRLVKGGELFIALPGEQSHGNLFVEKSFNQGATAVIAERQPAINLSSNNQNIIYVDNALAAFQTIAANWAAKYSLPKAAITGSMGKTFIKELAAAILLTTGAGCYSQKSYNNHVGVPYTLAKISPEHKWAVFELGMNHKGEMANLSKLVKPDVALVSCIAPVHTANFENLSGIADAKCEIIQGLKSDGTLIYNLDDQELKAGIARVKDQLPKNQKTFGYDSKADFQILGTQVLGLDGLVVKIKVIDTICEISLPVMGKHNAYNIAAAVSVAKTLQPDLTIEAIKLACSRFQPPPMRLNRYDLEDNRILIDDSYNSNPKALEGLIDFSKELIKQNINVGFIVGDMLELGAKAEEYHKNLAQYLAEAKPAFVIAVGEYNKVFKEAAAQQGVVAYAVDTPEAAAHTAEKLNASVIFVKASRGVGLDRASKTILARIGEKIPMAKMKESENESASGFIFKK